MSHPPAKESRDGETIKGVEKVECATPEDAKSKKVSKKGDKKK